MAPATPSSGATGRGGASEPAGGYANTPTGMRGNIPTSYDPQPPAPWGRPPPPPPRNNFHSSSTSQYRNPHGGVGGGTYSSSSYYSADMTYGGPVYPQQYPYGSSSSYGNYEPPSSHPSFASRAPNPPPPGFSSNPLTSPPTKSQASSANSSSASSSQPPSISTSVSKNNSQRMNTQAPIQPRSQTFQFRFDLPGSSDSGKSSASSDSQPSRSQLQSHPEQQPQRAKSLFGGRNKPTHFKPFSIPTKRILDKPKVDLSSASVEKKGKDTDKDKEHHLEKRMEVEKPHAADPVAQKAENTALDSVVNEVTGCDVDTVSGTSRPQRQEQPEPSHVEPNPVRQQPQQKEEPRKKSSKKSSKNTPQPREDGSRPTSGSAASDVDAAIGKGRESSQPELPTASEPQPEVVAGPKPNGKSSSDSRPATPPQLPTSAHTSASNSVYNTPNEIRKSETSSSSHRNRVPSAASLSSLSSGLSSVSSIPSSVPSDAENAAAADSITLTEGLEAVEIKMEGKGSESAPLISPAPEADNQEAEMDIDMEAEEVEVEAEGTVPVPIETKSAVDIVSQDRDGDVVSAVATAVPTIIVVTKESLDIDQIREEKRGEKRKSQEVQERHETHEKQDRDRRAQQEMRSDREGIRPEQRSSTAVTKSTVPSTSAPTTPRPRSYRRRTPQEDHDPTLGPRSPKRIRTSSNSSSSSSTPFPTASSVLVAGVSSSGKAYGQYHVEQQYHHPQESYRRSEGERGREREREREWDQEQKERRQQQQWEESVQRSQGTVQEQHHEEQPEQNNIYDSLSLGRVNISRTTDTYERLGQVGEGTYGKVYKARHVPTGDIVALKRVRIEMEREGFPITGIREIRILTSLRHANIVRLREILSDSSPAAASSSVYLVFEYMDHDLTGLLAHPSVKFGPADIKCLTKQMLEGLKYLHAKGIVHRDMKGSNLLLNARGELKLADFGLARHLIRTRPNKKRPPMDYTNRVITLWYRPPELLLGSTRYGPEIDMWSAGCIILELFSRKPAFPGSTEIDQLDFIWKLCGTPEVRNGNGNGNGNGGSKGAVWPGVEELPWWGLLRPAHRHSRKLREVYGKMLTPEAADLIDKLLQLDPAKRPTASEALAHPYFTVEEPPPTRLEDLPRIDGDWHEFESKQRKKQNKNNGVKPGVDVNNAKAGPSTGKAVIQQPQTQTQQPSSTSSSSSSYSSMNVAAAAPLSQPPLYATDQHADHDRAATGYQNQHPQGHPAGPPAPQPPMDWERDRPQQPPQNWRDARDPQL
ncbi:kinase subunit of RNA polymerase II carboxy-terminal domain kinase I, partial [Quaeritorhiza haematococci]